MKVLVAMAILIVAMNLFALTDGVKFCQNTNLGGLCTETTSTIFNLNGTYWYYLSGGILIPVHRNDAISSIEVASGWEAYVCTDANHYGSCRRFPYGMWNMTSYSGFNETISSITVQPASFEKANSFYGGGEYSEANITGFVYLYRAYSYGIVDTSLFRLFLKKGDLINDLSNYIVKKDQIASVELFGSVTPYACKGTSLSGTCKSIKSSYWDLNDYYSDYGWTNVNMRNQIESIRIDSFPSVGFWVASDANFYDTMKETALGMGGTTENLMFNRIEYWNSADSTITHDGNMDNLEYQSRLTVKQGDTVKFRKYGDNFDLLWISGHGNFYTYEDDNTATIWTTAGDWYIESGITAYYLQNILFQWANYIGAFHTDWFLTDACRSAGNGQAETVVIEAWNEVLGKVHGVGGMLNNAYWWGPGDVYDPHDFRDNIQAGNSIGFAFIDTMYHPDILGDHRWPRYFTMESCDCELTACRDSGVYQYDRLYGYGSQLPDKGNLANYDWYCRRSHVDFNSTPRTMMLFNQMADDGSITAQSYTAEPIDQKTIPSKLGLSSLDGKEISEEKGTVYEDERSFLKISPHKIFFTSLNEMRPLGRVDRQADATMEFRHLFEDTAWDLAASITDAPVSLYTVTADMITSYSRTQVALGLESHGGLVNRVQFVFVPVIDGRKVINEHITISFDANGLYTMRAKASRNYTQIGSEYKISADRIEQLIVEGTEDIISPSEAENLARSTEIYYIRDMQTNNIRPALFVKKDENDRHITTIFLDE